MNADIERLRNWVDAGRKCPSCRGAGTILEYRPTIYETDDHKEIEDAYRMASGPCPDCPDFRRVLAAFDAAESEVARLLAEKNN